jgi:hypothetical protein
MFFSFWDGRAMAQFCSQEAPPVVVNPNNRLLGSEKHNFWIRRASVNRYLLVLKINSHFFACFVVYRPNNKQETRKL